MKKQTISLGLFITLLSVTLTPAFAQTVTPTTGKPVHAAVKDANLSKLNTLCSDAISQRLTRLNDVKTRISGLVKLSDAQKQQFTNEIMADISALQTLQGQCMTDFNAGNVTALRTDYHTIFTHYRIYAEFLPQTDLLVAADTLSVTANKLSDLATKLHSRIQSSGNPSNLTTLLSDMQAKISDANAQVSAIDGSVTSLTPQSYDNNPSDTKNTLQTARANLKTGRTDLDTAWSDAKQILQGLKVTITPSPAQ